MRIVDLLARNEHVAANVAGPKTVLFVMRGTEPGTGGECGEAARAPVNEELPVSVCFFTLRQPHSSKKTPNGISFILVFRFLEGSKEI